jgi:hypothetical protein
MKLERPAVAYFSESEMMMMMMASIELTCENYN